MKDKLIWYIVDKEYVSYLKEFDNKVENIDYSNRFKPYLGIIITINEINYYVPISSVKEKHYKMNEDIDFIKISENDRILGVLNLNNMIPVCDRAIINYNISQDKDYFLLRKEIAFCNLHKKNINSDSKRIYNAVITHSWQSLENRCCNFKLLEEYCFYFHSQNF